MKKRNKILVRILIILLVFIIVTIVFISPITKYLIEKYDEEYTGRTITLDWVYVNIFTGSIHINDLKILEHESDSVFFQCDGIGINLSMVKLLTGTYEISSLTMDHPVGKVIQNNKNFNFDDIIEKFRSDKKEIEEPKKEVHFNLLDVKITNGYFTYVEEVIPIHYSIMEFNFESEGYHWNVDSISASYSLRPADAPGMLSGDIMYNLKNSNYRLNAFVEAFDMQLFDQYLADLSNYGSLTANLDADVSASGNLKDAQNITASGTIALNDFHFGKKPGEDYASFDKLELVINELSPINRKYLFDTLWLSHPYFNYERYDSLDNIQTVFGKKGENISTANSQSTQTNLILKIADYVKELAKNFFQSVYQLNTLKVENADIHYNDYTQRESFAMALHNLNFDADSIDKNHGWVNFSLSSKIHPFGNMHVNMDINPKDSSDFKLKYAFEEIPLTMFNPFIISQTSYHLDRGTMELKGSWNVRNGIIESDNHLLIIDPRITKRMRSKDAKWLPLPLVFAFVRERGNVVDYEIPITGDLKDPKFHLRDVLTDILGNIFVKPPTTPYILNVKNLETKIEESLQLKWPMNKSSLLAVQERFVEKMAKYLIKHPEASISIVPEINVEKEKEYILISEAKKKYYQSSKGLSNEIKNETDVKALEKLSLKDPGLNRYLDKMVSDTLLFTTQAKMSRLISADVVNKKFEELRKERETVFLEFFKQEGVAGRVKMKKAETKIPYNWFSLYKIEYQGELPAELKEAYEKMNELNDEAPRKEFKEARKRNKRNSPIINL